MGSNSLGFILTKILEIFNFIIFLRAMMSWLMPNPYNRFYLILIKITEPVLGPIRRVLPRSAFDFSPIVAMVLISIVSRFIYTFLY